MKITISKEWQDASAQASLRFMEFLLASEGSIGVNLATGNSPKYFYSALAKQFAIFESEKERLRFFHLDEFLDCSDSLTYSEELKNGPLSNWSIKEAQFFPWKVESKDPDSICLTMASQWHSHPRKICILGIGENGHIGFNEPGSTLASTARKIDLADTTRAALSDRFGGESVPNFGIGFGIADILAADKILLFASGAAKAKIVARALHGEISPECPASFLRLHNNVDVFLDEAAASAYLHEPELYSEEKVALSTESTVDGNILFLSPHPDDTSISAGGFLARHAEKNLVKTINLYSGHRSEIPNTNTEGRVEIRKKEAEAEAKALNIAMEFPQLKGYDDDYSLLDEDIEYLVEQVKSSEAKHIFVPWIHDPHPAHRATTALLFKALENVQAPSGLRIWFYETPWGLFRPGEMNTFVALSKDETITKLKAIGMHQSQVQRSAYDYAADALTRLRSVVSLEQEFSGYGKAHGVDLGKNVECFYCIRAN